MHIIKYKANYSNKLNQRMFFAYLLQEDLYITSLNLSDLEELSFLSTPTDYGFESFTVFH